MPSCTAINGQLLGAVIFPLRSGFKNTAGKGLITFNAQIIQFFPFPLPKQTGINKTKPVTHLNIMCI